ncbi:MAG: right-handed parallel beta-helix repeat-containing protein [Methanolobus sp.]|uniref:right-handed parallel beta-helix repeat-containing protein n=1 Tax=Methanolobus sp. TaxID=1874737 RepID=UPI0027303CAE|nr:right-handed parallel beta-helix repeat-containing protein [Methanolobus sp.]MDP2216895.1 right-handed parallel beta-helix repeat-containing protein [Methanolobus sp.]
MYCKRKTASLLLAFLVLNISLGAAISSAVVSGSSAEVNYSISISKDAGITRVQTIDGKTLYSGTNDVQAFNTAVNAISKGTILVNQGTYNIASPIALKSNIEIVGKNAVIKGYNVFTITSATNVTVRGFEFSNPTATYTSIASSRGFINIVNSNNCLIEGNTFRNFRDYGVYIGVSSTSHYNRNISVKNNSFLDYGYCGVMIGKQSNYIYVEDNTFKNINMRKVNANAYGIAVAKGSNSYKHSEHIYIRSNWIENSPVWEGIDSHGANHVYIQDNTVINCKVPIAVSYQTNEGTYPLPVHTIVITGNYVKGNMNAPEKQHSGIHVLGARNYAKPYTNVTVSGNTIIDVNSWLVSDDGAIVLRDVNGVVVDNNLITGVGGTGINLLNTDNALVQNNDIKNLKKISGSTMGVKMSPVAKSFSATIKNNKYDSTVNYHGYAYPRNSNTYSVTLVNQVQSKFAGALRLNVQTDSNVVTSPYTPPLTPPQPGTRTEPTDNADVTNSWIGISKNAGTTVVKTDDGKIVYSGNNDVEAVKAALNNVYQGTIVFEEGTYAISSAVALNSDLELVGNNAVLNGYSIFTIKDETNVTIRGFVFSNPDAQYLGRAGNNGLIDIQNSEDVFVQDNVFRNFRDFGIYLATRTASDSSQNVTVKDNQFLDYGYCGIMIGKQASNVTVEDNLFRNINVRAMYVNSYGVAVMKDSSTYDYSEYVYIRGNTLENNPTGEAIDSHGANNLYVENNTITDCRIPIYIVHVNHDDKYPAALSNLSVIGNSVTGDLSLEKQNSGIYIFGGVSRDGTIVQPYQGLNISGNTIADVNNWLVSDDGAIVLRNINGAVIENNDISGAGGVGINMENADNVVMQSNTFSGMREISGSTVGVKMLASGMDQHAALISNIFDSSVGYHARAESGSGHTYEVSVTNQDISLFDNSNESMKLIVLEEPAPQEPADDLPVANAAGRVADAGSTVIFYGGESFDKYGIVTYSWDFDDSDGIQRDATGMIVNHTFEEQGRYIVTLTISNMKGQTSTDTLTVIVK